MGHPAFVPVAESRVRVKKILLIVAAGMPSLENHEGWGNRFVVLRTRPCKKRKDGGTRSFEAREKNRR
jgi:hypothetical protein